MFNVSFQRTSTERAGDSTISIRSMSYNVPGHGDRLKAHRKRVQRDYFDSGLHYKEMHNAQGGGINA